MLKFVNLKIVTVIIFIAFLVGVYFLTTEYFDQADKIDASNDRIDELQAEIDTIQKEYDNLPRVQESQILRLESELENQSNLIPDQIDLLANEVVRTILWLGSKNDVTVVPLANKAWSSLKLGSESYQQLKISVYASGIWDHIIDFLYDLQTTEFATLACSYMKVIFHEGDQTGAQIELSVYAE
jgi:hypothetical protein